MENNIKVEMIFKADISGMFNDKSNLPEQRKAELMHNDLRFFPLTTTSNTINKHAYSIQRADGKASANDRMQKLGNLSFAKRQTPQIKVLVHTYICL